MLYFENKKWDDIVMMIKVERLKYWLEVSNYDETKAKELINGFTHGFDLGYERVEQRRDFAKNIPLSIGTETDLWNKVMKEVELG